MEVFNIKYEVFTKKNCNSKLIFIGDLHGWIDNEQIGKVVDNIKSENPDIIMIAGDILNESYKWHDQKAIEKVKRLLKNMGENKADIVTVLGNHDTHYIDDELIKNYMSLEDNNIHPLLNTSVNINKNNENIHIAGFVSNSIDGVTAYTNRFAKKNGVDQRPQRIIKTLEPLLDLNSEQINILLAHDSRQLRMPQVDEATKMFDVRLTAHIHNGYIPFKKTIKDKNYLDQDCQHYLFLGIPKLKSRNFARGVAYGNNDFYVLCTQTGDYFLVKYNEILKDNEYKEISKDFAYSIIKNYKLTPTIISGGINRYVGLPIEGSEITTFSMKK